MVVCLPWNKKFNLFPWSCVMFDTSFFSIPFLVFAWTRTDFFLFLRVAWLFSFLFLRLNATRNKMKWVLFLVASKPPWSSPWTRLINVVTLWCMFFISAAGWYSIGKARSECKHFGPKSGLEGQWWWRRFWWIRRLTVTTHTSIVARGHNGMSFLT